VSVILTHQPLPQHRLTSYLFAQAQSLSKQCWNGKSAKKWHWLQSLQNLQCTELSDSLLPT